MRDLFDLSGVLLGGSCTEQSVAALAWGSLLGCCRLIVLPHLPLAVVLMKLPLDLQFQSYLTYF